MSAGLCESCNVTEDTFHFLISCTRTAILRKKIYSIQNLEINQKNYQRLINNPEVQDILVNFIQDNHIEI